MARVNRLTVQSLISVEDGSLISNKEYRMTNFDRILQPSVVRNSSFGLGYSKLIISTSNHYYVSSLSLIIFDLTNARIKKGIIKYTHNEKIALRPSKGIVLSASNT